MKKFVLIVAFVLFCLNTKASVYDDITHSLSSKLGVVSGSVVNVTNKGVILDKGSKDGLYEHSIVYIYRNLGTLHAFSDNKSVKLKKGIAYAYVSNIKDSTATALISAGVDKDKDYLLGLGLIPWGEKILIGKPKANDKFIAGKKEYRVAIITRNKIIYSSLKSSLEKTGKFYVINPDKLAIAITNSRINTLSEKTSIKKLAEAVDADLVLLIASDKNKILKVKVYNGYGGVKILTLYDKIDKESKIILSKNKKLNSTIPANNIVASNLRLSRKLTFWETILDKAGLYSPYTGLDMSSAKYKVAVYKELGYGTTAMYVGCATSKNQKDILLAKGSNITIYGFDSDSFVKKGTFSYGYNIINIDTVFVEDRVLIAVSNFNRYGEMASAVGYLDKDYKFHIIKDNIPYHIRFYNKFSNPVLIAEKATISKPFAGKIYSMDIKSGKVKKLSLPVNGDNFYNFEKVDNYIVYVSKSGQLLSYNTDTKKIISKTPYAFGYGERAIQRYDYEGNTNQESMQEIEKRNNVYIKKSVSFFKGVDDKIYALGIRNYMSNTVTINQQHYNAYSVKLISIDDGELNSVWSSGDVKGRVVAAGKIGDYVISVIGLPAGFFDRFVRGIEELDRLVAAKMTIE